MDILSVARYLDSLDIGLRLTGTEKNLFLHHMPSEVKAGVLLRDGMGGTPIDMELPGFYKTEFQMIVRHTNHLEGRALADLVVGRLTIQQHQVIGAMNVRHIYPMNLPLVFPASDGDLLEWFVEFDACYSV